MICDFKKRGSTFIETAMYQECLHKLNSTRNLVISGNPGEGKTRYAVELMCSKTERGRRLFLTSAQQLENIDLEHIDGVIIDNIYGDVSFDEDKCKRWKEQMPYLIARCKNNRPFYVIVTSRSYILKSSTNQDIQCMKKVELLTTGLEMDERLSILKSHCSLDDPQTLIAAFKSPIGLPQICYMYSTCDKFCKEDIFRHPEVFIKKILQAFELENRMLLIALALVVFHRGTLIISDISNEEIDKINDYIKPNTSRYDVKMALDKLCGSFIQYSETNDRYQFIHDSLFETCCSYIGGRHSDLFISLSDVRVLIEFARIQNQVETADRIYAYIPNSRNNITNLVARYISAMQNDARLKLPLTNSDALFCEDLLSELLSTLEENDMVSWFLNAADKNESMLVELCNMNQPQLIKYILKAMDTFSDEDWVKSQKHEARIRCTRWGFIACLESLQTKDEFSSDQNSDASSDESMEEWYEPSVVKLRKETEIIHAMKKRDEKALRNLVDENILSEVELCNIMKARIEKGEEANICFETDPQSTNELIHHAVHYRNTSQFAFFMKRAIASRMSIRDNSQISDANLDNRIKRMINHTINDEIEHFVVLYCIVNNCWKPLCPLFEMEVSCGYIEYIHEMRKCSKTFSILSDNLSGTLAKSPEVLKVIHILRFARPNLIAECIKDFCLNSNPELFKATMESVIANRLSVQDREIEDSVYADVERMSHRAGKEGLHLLSLYFIANSCWEPLLYLLDIEIPSDDKEYIHDMKQVSERFKTLSDNCSDILVQSSQGLKVIHIILLERPNLTPECVHQSVRYGLSFVFSLAMKSCIANHLSVQASKTDAPLDDNVERMSECIGKEDVHRLALYCIVNSRWDSLLPFLEVEVTHDDIEYIHDMKDVSERFNTLSDHFSNILAISSQGFKVIHIVLSERPVLANKCLHQSVRYGLPFAFSLAMKRAVADRLSIQTSINDAPLEKNVERMSERVDKEDVHLLALYCVVNSYWNLLMPLLEVEVLPDDIEYIHDMKDVSERYKTLSDNITDVGANNSQSVQIIHIVFLERPDIKMNPLGRYIYSILNQI